VGGTRVDDLVARLDLDEKLAQLGCVWSTALAHGGTFSDERARTLMPHGIGEITRIGATTGLRPRERAKFANRIQRFLVEETRVGIPAIVHEESTAGLCARDATQFPQAIGLAATWDPALVTRVADVIREQMLATGARHTLAPVLDVSRDPRWGRAEETYGEDPYLASRMGVAYVRGLQTSDLRGGVAATGKHFLGYGLSEGGMNHAPVHLGPRELREVYAEPFRAAIAEAGLATVMNAYHSIDGLPCGGSKAVLDDLLRGELGFEGVVVADYFTTGLLITHHRVAADRREAGRRAIEAGLDMELPAVECYGAPLRELVERGDVDVALIDRSVRRVLTLKDALGVLDEPYVDEDEATRVYDLGTHRAVAREAAVESFVLLRNEGALLPLSSSLPSIAVIGPAANDERLLQGDYSYPAHTEITWKQAGDRGLMPTSDASSGMFAPGPYYPPSVTPLAGVRAAAPGAEIMYAPGCEVTGDDKRGFTAAFDAARAADVAIVCVGDRSGLLADCTSGEFRDVADLGLPGVQRDLVDVALATGTPVVLVVMSGRPHSLGDLAERVGAIVYAWAPGEQGGAALADVLFGAVAPSGRLPVSLPRAVGQVPVYHGHRAGGGRSQMLGDYVDLPTSPQWPFGFGLTYTTFEYSSLAVTPGTPAPGDEFTVEVDVTNIGAVDGVEVAQLYLRDDVARVARPVRLLAGFERVALAPGETRRVKFTVDPRRLAYYDEAMRHVIEPGTVTVMVGGSAGALDLRARITLTGDEVTIA
jgi:beta-glucosidase-like glycosyl hydrolase